MTEHEGLSQEDLHPPPSAQGMRIGLLGGSFNPPHAAHRSISLNSIKRLRLDQVWWLVSPGNPLKDHSDLAPLAERLRLCRLLVANDRRVRITAFEATLATTYTATTLKTLRRQFPDVHFVWLMGADNLAGFHRWKDWESIFELMPVAISDRPGWRYRALNSRAARYFERNRVPEKHALRLAELPAPAWCYLSGPLSDLSSTILRRDLKSGQD